jgi:hypothetical protein
MPTPLPQGKIPTVFPSPGSSLQVEFLLESMLTSRQLGLNQAINLALIPLVVVKTQLLGQ